MSKQSFIVVLAGSESHRPLVEIRSAKQGNVALLAVGPIIRALLLCSGTLSQTLGLVIVIAEHLTGLDAGSTHCIALGPEASLPLIATFHTLALLGSGRLGREHTFVVLPSAANHLPGLGGLTALGSTLPPLIDHPLGPLRVELLLHRQGRRQRRELKALRASQRLLAHQAALRLLARLRVATVPRTLRSVAHVVARDMFLALQRANRSPTLSRALGR
mmetsp:Transcript_14152/g.31419  ORF Transcript_14152/g.31419 Transcript_14152/m.31419 type:complete len:218 (+) Transcript_14152:745-1398(+)